MIAVSDAGPLVATARIGRLDLLPSLFGRICVPPSVWREVVVSGKGLAGSEETATAEWIRVWEVRDKAAVAFYKDKLDPGESEAIALALQLRADILLMDEAPGRRTAEALSLNKIGTVGILILAEEFRLIAGVTPLLESLRARGFYMSEELYSKARAMAGEL